MGRVIAASSVADRRRDLRIALEREGHVVAETTDARQTIEEAQTGNHDVLILDSDVDAGDPHGVCRTVRPASDLGIIVVIRDRGEYGEEQSRIDALNAGADDYVPEKFVVAELMARVRALLRRLGCDGERRERIVLHDRAIDLRSYKVQGPGAEQRHLTPKEFLVLKHLIACADRPVTNVDLARAVWQRDGSGDLEYVRIVIAQLRRKIEGDHNRPRYILTERSVGYRFKTPPREEGLPALHYPAHSFETGSPAMAR